MAEHKTKCILVVDDEPDIVTYLTTVLEDSGYQCDSAVDGIDGMNKVKANRPDLICLDITMPEKSGVRMYRELCEDSETAGIPVVIVTGVSNDFEKFISSRKQVPPPAGYIAKPVERDELLEKVRTLLEA